MLIYILVKYLREVTPYFRKTSALNDLGWGSPDKDANNSKNSTWIDKKTIPLKLCYLCRNLTMPDSQNRTIELHSPDGKSSCVIRCPDDTTATSWFKAFHTNVHLLTAQAMAEYNLTLSNATSNSREVKHMGWLAEQVSYLWLISYICFITFNPLMTITAAKLSGTHFNANLIQMLSV